MSTHKELYPSQYNHPLVGKTVRTRQGLEGVVTRVLPSRFGQLAEITGAKKGTAFGIVDLTIVCASGDCSNTPIQKPTGREERYLGHGSESDFCAECVSLLF